jgi:cell pole-organizing protein PopZ
METLKYTREDIKKQITEMRDSFNHSIDTLDRVFDIAFELDWNATMFKADHPVVKTPKSKRKTKDLETYKNIINNLSNNVSVADAETGSDPVVSTVSECATETTSDVSEVSVTDSTTAVPTTTKARKTRKAAKTKASESEEVDEGSKSNITEEGNKATD